MKKVYLFEVGVSMKAVFGGHSVTPPPIEHMIRELFYPRERQTDRRYIYIYTQNQPSRFLV